MAEGDKAGRPAARGAVWLALIALAAPGRHPARLRPDDRIPPFDYPRARTAARRAVAYARGPHPPPPWLTTQPLRALPAR